MSEAEVSKLPDPELFRDAVLLWQRGTWSADVLDGTDALLLAMVRKFLNAKRG